MTVDDSIVSICGFGVARSSTGDKFVVLVNPGYSQTLALYRSDLSGWTRIAKSGDVLPDGEPFDGGRGLEECGRGLQIDAFGRVAFTGRAYSGSGQRLYFYDQGTISEPNPIGYTNAPRLNDHSEIVYVHTVGDVRMIRRDEPPLPPPDPHHKIIFVEGINSGTKGHCDGVKQETRTMRDYLRGIDSNVSRTATQVTLTDDNFIYFDYSPDDDTCAPLSYCDDEISQSACGGYSDADTCLTIDDRGTDEGSSHHLDNLITALVDKDPEVTIDIIAHSQGGLVSAYWLAHFGTRDYHDGPGHPLYEHVGSITLVDSAPGGFQGASWFYPVACASKSPFDSTLWDSPSDMEDGSSVTDTVDGFQPAAGTDPPMLFAIDAYPGQAGNGVGPCDAVGQFNTSTGQDVMRIGSLRRVHGDVFRIWARTHGVIWSDDYQNDGSRPHDTNALTGYGSLIRGISGFLSDFIDVTSVQNIFTATDVLLHCQSAQVISTSGNTIHVNRGMPDKVKNGYVTIVGDTSDGMGTQARRALFDVLDCAVLRQAWCGVSDTYFLLAGATVPTTTSVSTGATSLAVRRSVSGGGTAAAVTALAGSSVSGPDEPVLRLVSPTGRQIDASSASDADVEYLSAPGFEQFIITNPEPGDWSVVLDGSAMTADSEAALSVVPTYDVLADGDQDGIVDTSDNCPAVPNGNQTDIDADGLGDACDDDMDGDAIANADDNCALAANPDQTNTDGDNLAANRAGADTLGDACDDDDDGDGYADDREIALGEDPVAYCDVMRADVNLTADPLVRGNGVINSLDLFAVAKMFGPNRGNVIEDQNGDGNINSLDLLLVAKKFLMNVSACP